MNPGMRQTMTAGAGAPPFIVRRPRVRVYALARRPSRRVVA